MIIRRSVYWTFFDGPLEDRRHGISSCLVEMRVGHRWVWTWTVEGEFDVHISPDTLIADYLGLPRRKCYFPTETEAQKWFQRLAHPLETDELTDKERALHAQICHPWMLFPPLGDAWRRPMKLKQKVSQSRERRRSMNKLNIHPLVELARKFADRACPDLHFPSDGSTLVQAQPMPGWLRQMALELMGKTGGYKDLVSLVFDDFSADIHYVRGFVDRPRPTEHAWLQVGGAHYDPIRELSGSAEGDYLPAFELNPEQLNRLTAKRGCGFAPDIGDLVIEANWKRRQRERDAAKRRPGASHLRLVDPPKGETL